MLEGAKGVGWSTGRIRWRKILGILGSLLSSFCKMGKLERERKCERRERTSDFIKWKESIAAPIKLQRWQWEGFDVPLSTKPQCKNLKFRLLSPLCLGQFGPFVLLLIITMVPTACSPGSTHLFLQHQYHSFDLFDVRAAANSCIPLCGPRACPHPLALASGKYSNTVC